MALNLEFIIKPYLSEKQIKKGYKNRWHFLELKWSEELYLFLHRRVSIITTEVCHLEVVGKTLSTMSIKESIDKKKNINLTSFLLN